MKIQGISIPDHETIHIGLTKIYGIGRKNVFDLLNRTKIDPKKRIKSLTKEEVALLIKVLEDFETEGDLRKRVSDNITRLKAIHTYRGIRHILNLPVRGQRTKVNARTKRGSKKTVGSLTKEMWAKIEAQQKAARS